MATYSAADVTIAFGEILISGFGPNDFISVEATNPTTTLTEGADGASHFNRSASSSGKATVTCIGSSLANDLLSAAYNADRISGGGAKPFFAKDNSSALSFVTSEAAKIEGPPPWTKGRELGETVWVFLLTSMIINHGGTITP